MMCRLALHRGACLIEFFNKEAAAHESSKSTVYSQPFRRKRPRAHMSILWGQQSMLALGSGLRCPPAQAHRDSSRELRAMGKRFD